MRRKRGLGLRFYICVVDESGGHKASQVGN
jgi:hypothetical protein